jgi:hypothetical protein
LRRVRRLRLFENRVLRKIFGPKRGEVTGEWKKLHNEKFYALYSSLNIVLVIKIKNTEMGGACKANGREEGRVSGFCGET